MDSCQNCIVPDYPLAVEYNVPDYPQGQCGYIVLDYPQALGQCEYIVLDNPYAQGSQVHCVGVLG